MNLAFSLVIFTCRYCSPLLHGQMIERALSSQEPHLIYNLLPLVHQSDALKTHTFPHTHAYAFTHMHILCFFKFVDSSQPMCYLSSMQPLILFTAPPTRRLLGSQHYILLVFLMSTHHPLPALWRYLFSLPSLHILQVCPHVNLLPRWIISLILTVSITTFLYQILIFRSNPFLSLQHLYTSAHCTLLLENTTICHQDI